MPRWLPRVLTRIGVLASARKVSFTLKARRELAELGMGLDQEDACEVLAGLRARDSAGRQRSISTDEWMYVFTPALDERVLYIKVILRSDCIVVSFHEDRAEP